MPLILKRLQDLFDENGNSTIDSDEISFIEDETEGND